MHSAGVLRANERGLMQWSGAAQRARYDYISENHLIDDMLNDFYFGGCWATLRKGDLITITDAEDKMITVRVDDIDRASLRASLSIIERLSVVPVIDKTDNSLGIAYRWRGPRGGGHSIVTADAVIAINFASKEAVDTAISVMRQNNSLVPPRGHEPAGYVKKEV